MKVLIKTVAGSHLFGTNTEASDKDYKGVFLPDARDILLCNNVESLNQSTGNSIERNSKDDVDVEMFSVRKFLKMTKNGDTAALELLFTPEKYILEKDPLWDVIVQRRQELLSSRVTAMIGYARQQANKYGIKGSRMGELNNIIKFLKNLEKKLNFPNPKLKHAWEDIQIEIKEYDHVEEIELELKAKDQTKIPALDILGKKFDHHCSIPYVLDILKKIYKNYGQRAREARNNNGVDWKALSHAVRVMYQGIELLQYHKITLPLPHAYLMVVKDIKMGKMDYREVSHLIENLLEELERVKSKSTLPERVNQKIIEDITLELHMEQLKDFKI